tara:strand:+ start:58653 stop:59516 length:864 start_codon:yes stop_codon:yes gene_type:complete
MTTSLDAILGQYEKNQSPNTEKKFVSNEERLKKYFAPFLPKGQTDGEKTVRILPTADGSSPFKEVYFHETQVQGKWMKIYDPGKNSDGSLSGERSPLNEVEDALRLTGNQQDKELARQYRSKKFYIVKVIDRENEDDGVKFWRFKHNWKGDGIMDKLIPLFQKRGDLTNLKEGRDVTLILKAVPLPSGNGTYTAVSMVMSEDPSVLHTDENTSKPWIANAEEWSDVYSQKPVEYLEAIAKGETPIWNNETKKYSYDSATEESIDMSQDSKTNVDPQANQSVDQDLPF